jgi:hypothetical protein
LAGSATRPEPPRHAVGLIWLDPETLGNGVNGHVAPDSVARKVADRPQAGH